MKHIMTTTSGRGAAGARSSHMHAGGLSMAFSGENGGKKRSLGSIATAGGAPPSDGGFGTASATSSLGDFQQQQHQQLLQPPLPAGGLSSQFSADGGFGSYNPEASPALSPLSATTPHGSQRSPLCEALAISASAPRRKLQRRQPALAVFGAADASNSDESDGDVAGPIGGGAAAAADSSGGWTIAQPPHLMTSGAMSLPQHAAELYPNVFRPGSVMEGAGRKLRGTEAMRMRNAVLRQTGFLEPQLADNMFADHAGSGAPLHAAS